MSDILMPKLSDTMEEGRVIRWLVSKGDEISKGDPIAEIETDKANVEFESSESGIFEGAIVHEGELVPVGTPIASIAPKEELAGSKGGGIETPPAEEKAEEPPAYTHEEPIEREEPKFQPVIEPDGVKASPLAKKIARDAGVDLIHIEGTGPCGRIVEEDVRKFLERGSKPAQKPTPHPEPVSIPETEHQTIERGHIWETVGRVMTQSKQQTPHFYVAMEINMTNTMELREMLNSARPLDKQITINDFLIKACAITLPKHKTMNASLTGENTIELHSEVNIGIAVAIPQGLIAPVIRNCEKKTLTEISNEARELIVKTRKGQIQPDEYSGGTFTISNLGMYGVDEFSAIIVPPQSAILSVGAVMPKATVVNNRVEVQETMKLTVSGDHRVTDGARVAEFMRDLKSAIENPAVLIE